MRDNVSNDIPQRVQQHHNAKEKPSPFQAHKHHSNCQARTFSFLGSPVLNSVELDTLRDLGAVLGQTPDRLLPAVLDRAAGPHADLPGPLNAVYPDHLLRLKPFHTHTAPERRAELDPEGRVRRWWKEKRESGQTSNTERHTNVPAFNTTSGAALSCIARWSVWMQSDSFPGSNTSVTGRVRETHTEREREGERSCSSHSEASQCWDRFIYVSCPPDSLICTQNTGDSKDDNLNITSTSSPNHNLANNNAALSLRHAYGMHGNIGVYWRNCQIRFQFERNKTFGAQLLLSWGGLW